MNICVEKEELRYFINTIGFLCYAQGRYCHSENKLLEKAYDKAIDKRIEDFLNQKELQSEK